MFQATKANVLLLSVNLGSFAVGSWANPLRTRSRGLARVRPTKGKSELRQFSMATVRFLKLLFFSFSLHDFLFFPRKKKKKKTKSRTHPRNSRTTQEHRHPTKNSLVAEYTSTRGSKRENRKKEVRKPTLKNTGDQKIWLLARSETREKTGFELMGGKNEQFPKTHIKRDSSDQWLRLAHHQWPRLAPTRSIISYS